MRPTLNLVAVVMIAGLAAAATADPVSPRAADLAFLDSIAEPAASRLGEVTLPEDGKLDLQSSTCEITSDCGDGNSVSCTGTAICKTTIAGVSCNGTEVQCPNFCQIGQSCDCCNGPYTGFCWSRRGDCQYTNEGIMCDGRTFTCARMCPRCQEW
jgi:hypothetical protein